ncbi:hypothetical protein BGZ83_005020, partial [Gryganskiella cystojenkinii]
MDNDVSDLDDDEIAADRTFRDYGEEYSSQSSSSPPPSQAVPCSILPPGLIRPPPPLRGYDSQPSVLGYEETNER